MSGGIMAIIASLEKEAADKGVTVDQLAKMEDEKEGALALADHSDKELDRNPTVASMLTAPIGDLIEVVPMHSIQGTSLAGITQVIMTGGTMPEPEPVQFEMPPQQYMKKGMHHTLVFQGVCSHCAHCGMQLTDAVSIERGLGPVCSKRGYLEDPKDPDEMQAMIDLAEYPQLVEYLVSKYKPETPNRVRGLMNGLVRICSLNRRSPVHQACCDAIESLGYKDLASTLRESIAIIEVKNQDEKTLHVWVKKSEWHYAWQSDLRAIPGAYFSRREKGWLVPKASKHLLWAYMLKHYSGLCAKVPTSDGKRTVKITAAYQPAGQAVSATA